MSYQSGRYNVHGSWAAMPVRRATGPADPAIMRSPAFREAMAKIERAFGGKDRPR
ncbi:MAG: hypothetical protein ACR2F8_06020 [Caulobacteraceae bacterium]